MMRKFRAEKIQAAKFVAATPAPKTHIHKTNKSTAAKVRTPKIRIADIRALGFRPDFRALRIRKEWASARAAMLSLALVIALLPFSLATSDNSVRQWFSNRAFAAINPAASRMLADGINLSESRRAAASLRAAVSEDSSRLIGLRGREIALAFPAPELERRDGDVSVRQYRVENCIVDVYFSGDDAAGQGKVIYFEERRRGKAVLGAKSDPAATGPGSAGCLKTVLSGPSDFSVAFAAAIR